MLLLLEKQNVFITRSDTAYLQFIPEDQKTKQEYEFQDGDSVIFRIQLDKDNFEKECFVDLATNECTLKLTPDETANLDFRTYYYEVELITADEDHYTFITGRLTIGREIENHESG